MLDASAHAEPPTSSSKASPVVERLGRWLGAPVNGTSLAFFRVAFGIVMLLESLAFFRASFSSGGMSQLDVYYAGADVRFHMPYLIDACIAPLPRWVFVGAGGLLGLGAAGMAMGLWYRVSSVMVLGSWGFLYGIESTRTYWMSYYWLELLVALGLAFMPAANRVSVDAIRRPRPAAESTVPRWTVALLRAQLVVTYFYAGVAKLNPDWLADLMPVRWFLEQPHVAARLRGFLGDDLAARVTPWLMGRPGAAFFSWPGAAFDVAVGFLLLHRRTRLLALGLTWAFHGINHFLLFEDIEWFPLLGATSATVFLEPDWPEHWARWFRNPRWIGPDWRWALPGLVLVPGFGILLGWRGRRAPSPAEARATRPFPAWGTAILGSWLVLQVLVPARHLAFRGDPRVTFEGLSFSWRLKTEYYQTHPAEIVLEDRAVLEAGTGGAHRIHWKQWPGPRVLYRAVERGRIDWSLLPAMCVVADPGLGDRILFNPMARGVSARDEEQARQLVNQTWQSIHGRAPDAVHRAVSLGAIVDSYMHAAAQKGARLRSRDEAMALMDREHGRRGNGTMIPFLRRSHPFASGYDDASPLPFLWIEDSRLVSGAHPALPRIQLEKWIPSPAFRGRMDDHRIDEGAEPVVVLVERPEHEPLPMPAMASLWDSASKPDRPTEIRWDGLTDAGNSKYMHVSLNPFLLRRYARRVADAWSASTGRTPAVHARTFVGLNRRPPQAMVDPAADLAGVGVTWFGHSPWIRDIETRRIPER